MSRRYHHCLIPQDRSKEYRPISISLRRCSDNKSPKLDHPSPNRTFSKSQTSPPDGCTCYKDEFSLTIGTSISIPRTVELTSVPGGQNAMAHLKKRKLEAESAATKQQPKHHQQLGNSLSTKKTVHQISVSTNEMEVSDTSSNSSNSANSAKRRRKSVRDDQKSVPSDDSITAVGKNIPLPQKKRVFSGSPARKATCLNKTNSEQEPEADDETLIRETEAALKSLSGSWVPGPRGSSFYQRGNSDEDKYESNFENLFEEKKDGGSGGNGSKMSPSSMSQSSTTSNDTGCSLKDVITLRGQHDRQNSRIHQQQLQQQQNKNLDSQIYKHQQMLNGGKIRREDHADGNNQVLGQQSQGVNRSGNRQDKYSRYEPPDFNELVDESSNELEIDMSDPTADSRNNDNDHLDKDKINKSDSKHHLYSSGYQRSYEGLKSPVGSSSFSIASAFRPPNTDHTKNGCRTGVTPSSIPPMGPYPASATFVGYPTPGPTIPMPQPVAGVVSPPIDEKHSSTVSLLQLKSPKEESLPSSVSVTGTSMVDNTGKSSPNQGMAPISSPDADSKQYTILQPAGLGSRAASAIQDIAREGVVSVTAVSSSANNSVAVPVNKSGNGSS
ncbi:hypothetical protein QAD02_015853, partial [Eretmocerus hayati]